MTGAPKGEQPPPTASEPSETAAARTVRWAFLGLGLLLPVVALIPLGTLWLWQGGWLPWWALGTCLTTGLAWAAQRWLLRPANTSEPQQQSSTRSDFPPDDDQLVRADPAWTPAERAAWQRVVEIAKATEPSALERRESVLDLGKTTVEAVATALHPERQTPLLQFTAPEALALIERVSARMHTFVRENVPLSDRLTLAQIATLYRWRGAIDATERAYDVWRAIRMINPTAAVTSEIRERLSKELMAWGKQHLAKKLAEAFVEEVGRAAIDLYGGRLRISQRDLAAHISTASSQDLAAAEQRPAEPLRILVAGQVSSGKSCLINALAEEMQTAVDALPMTGDFTPHRLDRDGLPAALIIDTPGLTPFDAADPRALVGFLEQADRCDLIIWLLAANRADRALDRAAIDAVRGHYAARPDRRSPPMLVLLSHVDRLRPFNEWRPPYDLNAANSAKAASMRDAIAATAADLDIATTDIIPVCLSAPAGTYNVDTVWAAVMDRLPEAERARLVRTVRDAEGSWDWRQIWSQARSGGRVLVRSALGR